jgi:hypothetical protein
MLIANPAGNYRFLPGIEPYSCGAVADEGFEVIHAVMRRPVPYREGFDFIEAHLAKSLRPKAALCGVELRSPKPFTRQGFIDFNIGYRAVLEDWVLIIEGQNPVARTNVAPVWNPPSEPSLYGFSYTTPCDPGLGPTFVVAGAGELRGGGLLEAAVVRPGESSAEAMSEKASYVMHVMTKRLLGLGVDWDAVTTTDIYTAEAMDHVFGATVLDKMGAATTHGLRWYHTRPPIDELVYEMDCRGVRRELVVEE